MIYFSDFGDGWAPAVLNSPEELSFILKGFKNIGLSHNRHYIGGSARHGPNKIIKYFEYHTNGSGNHFVYQRNNMFYGVPRLRQSHGLKKHMGVYSKKDTMGHTYRPVVSS